MKRDEYKQLYDIICDEVNVKALMLGYGLTYTGDWREILYTRETRKISLGETKVL